MDEIVAQFSIYKIDKEKVSETFFPNENDIEVKNMLHTLLKSVEKIVREKKSYGNHIKLKYKGFMGLLFKTVHQPGWKTVLEQIIKNNEYPKKCPDQFLSNTNISYVLFYIYNECIYCMTGGYGSFYVNRFVERNYGLYLLPKILEKENPVVKHVTENNLIGNRTSTHRTNRSTTSFTAEQDLSSIYKELNVEIDRGIATTIGIEFDKEESKEKRINLINKDSLVIRRSMSLSNLIKVLTKLNALEQKEDNFALNYLVLAKKKGMKKVELDKHLIENFKEKIYNSFVLVGDDYEDYILNMDKYKIIKSDGEVFLESTVPITLDNIFDEISKQEPRLTKILMKEILNSWKVETIDHYGNQGLYPQAIRNVLQGFIEYGDNKTPCYLINGNWYVFDNVYSDLLNNEYRELFNSMLPQATFLKKAYNLDKRTETEQEYNVLLAEESNIIVTDTITYNNVEFADAIFWDDKTLYLMHNKIKFNGKGSRDLINQILTAAECLQKSRGINGVATFLPKYYQNICKKKNAATLPQASESEFIDLFANKKICFIAGFIKGYNINSDSIYAKYLTIEAHKKLLAKNCAFIPMGIQ